jgi:hypothetical protein
VQRKTAASRQPAESSAIFCFSLAIPPKIHSQPISPFSTEKTFSELVNVYKFSTFYYTPQVVYVKLFFQDFLPNFRGSVWTFPQQKSSPQGSPVGMGRHYSPGVGILLRLRRRVERSSSGSAFSARRA